MDKPTEILRKGKEEKNRWILLLDNANPDNFPELFWYDLIQWLSHQTANNSEDYLLKRDPFFLTVTLTPKSPSEKHNMI